MKKLIIVICLMSLVGVVGSLFANEVPLTIPSNCSMVEKGRFQTTYECNDGNNKFSIWFGEFYRNRLISWKPQPKVDPRDIKEDIKSLTKNNKVDKVDKVDKVVKANKVVKDDKDDSILEEEDKKFLKEMLNIKDTKEHPDSIKLKCSVCEDHTKKLIDDAINKIQFPEVGGGLTEDDVASILNDILTQKGEDIFNNDTRLFEMIDLRLKDKGRVITEHTKNIIRTIVSNEIANYKDNFNINDYNNHINKLVNNAIANIPKPTINKDALKYLENSLTNKINAVITRDEVSKLIADAIKANNSNLAKREYNEIRALVFKSMDSRLNKQYMDKKIGQSINNKVINSLNKEVKGVVTRWMKIATSRVDADKIASEKIKTKVDKVILPYINKIKDQKKQLNKVNSNYVKLNSMYLQMQSEMKDMKKTLEILTKGK